MKRLSFDVPDDLYDRLWDMKQAEHPDDDDAIDHAAALGVLLDRYEGKRRARPDVLAGATGRIAIPRRGRTAGKAYVNINVDERGDPFETFIVVGDSGGVVNSWSNALAKTISNALRAGVDGEIIADDLMGIRGPHTPADDNGDLVLSVPDGVGIVLRRFIEGKLGGPTEPPQAVRGIPEDVKGVED